jgi:uncharacterized membrane protein YgdD (TMEM256/DUF423 family)
MKGMSVWMGIGSVLAALGVALGAFGAHALHGRVPPETLAVFETGVRYHMYHALALFAVAWAADPRDSSSLVSVAGWCFVLGIILFSGSLYGLALTGMRGLRAATPVGGLAFMAGWGLLALSALRTGRA